jgi:hypothetical protein
MPRVWLALSLVLGIPALAGMIYFMASDPPSAVVEEHRWRSTIELEEFSTFGATAWRSEIPPTATPRDCAQKTKTWKSVPDGERCTYSGRRQSCTKLYKDVSDRSEEHCTYDKLGWHPVEPLMRDGTGMSPEFPDDKQLFTGSGTLEVPVGARREASRQHYYLLVLRHGDRRETCGVPEATWRNAAVGDSIPLNVIGGRVMKCP